MRKQVLLFLVIQLIAVSSSLYAQTKSRAVLERNYNATFIDNNTSAATNFLAFRLAQPLSLSGNSITEKANAFWQAYGDLFNQSATQVHLVRSRQDGIGNTHLTFQQNLAAPVFGAEINLHFNTASKLYAAEGFYLRSATEWNKERPTEAYPLPDYPAALPPSVYEQAAINYLRKNYAAINWTVTSSEPVLLASSLLNNGTDELVWCQHMLVREDKSLLEYELFFDLAQANFKLVLQKHCEALDRALYTGNTDANNLIWEEGDNFPGSLSNPQQTLLEVTEETYNLFRYTFNRDSYDDAGGTMRIVDEATNIGCPNARSNGGTTLYCAGTTADDVIGHEWTHSYTGEINGLIYAWESGAINEGFSDVFGEVIDLLNTSGTDTNDSQPRSSCSENNNERWKMGEDATAFGGHIRDMWNPECKGDPSARTANAYTCSSNDNGGVHSNSGVLNRCFSLLTDGGTLNGTTVNGIGLTKATHVFHQAWIAYTNRVTDYDAMGIGLQSAANDLIGQNLTALTLEDSPAGPSGEIFTAADAQQVTNAVTATAMLLPNNCNFSPALATNPPENCPTAGTVFVSLLNQDWENGLDGFTSTNFPSNPEDWTNRDWEIDAQLPDQRAGQGIFIANAAIGNCTDDVENGYVDLRSPTITIPAVADELVLSFNHWFSTENGWDGGHVLLVRNGGAPTLIEASDFIFNAYNRELNENGNDNPMAGEGTFSGANEGSTSGSWGQSQIDLSAAGVQVGDEIALIWRMSYDGCNGWLGWYLDEVAIGYCIEEALPVEYLSFTAREEATAISLNWSTAREVNNLGFQILRRSETANAFKQIHFVAAGQETGDQYQYLDQDVKAGVTYFYQLAQMDADAAVNHSNIVSAAIKGQSGTQLTISPNPVDNKWCRVFWSATAGSETKHLQLYTSSGHLVREWTQQASGNRLELSGLPPSVYFLKAGKSTQRIIVY